MSFPNAEDGCVGLFFEGKTLFFSTHTAMGNDNVNYFHGNEIDLC
jgi:hypothetical protein